ncbi:ATP-dependent DNA ligase [Sulfodiicoccus acidiphilus]|uniref:DNA ligase n=1 Tax=Sulfodiicoccus acidiphilus TaxID=1670455 RepID=A0A348B2V2_9CREN|nr:ATP-dependent DNA ligase [Sulfodiicoccus acidiphilus]BBD72504.1 ATP-dependent DNA ligase [Sulfodiicoccus acidiphilus]GGT94066.1 ATP-dependent DNA ligase [Sulfodiicoccus acidiphilus]
MKFGMVAEYFAKLEDISSRLQLSATLAELFRSADKAVLDKVVYLIQGKLWPDFLGMPEIGVGEKLLIKAVALGTGRNEGEVESVLRKMGDLGEVAASLKGGNKMDSLTAFLGTRDEGELTVEEVHEKLAKVALASGERSRDIKVRTLAGLVKRATPIEAKYIVRFVDGKLRLGIGDATILDALSQAFGGSKADVERAYNLRADLGQIAKLLAEGGAEAISSVRVTVGIPVRVMLAERLSEAGEIMEKVGGKALVDYKYDGERAQIHRKGQTVTVFSRRMENITSQYPDVVQWVRDYLKAEELICEGEIVAVDPATGDMRPFQELMHRKRKADVLEATKEYPVNLFLFDLLYLEGEDFTTKNQLERRRKLEELVSQEQDKVKVAQSMIVEDRAKLEEFFFRAISDGAEGVMVKSISPDSIYQAGARGWLWIKLKRDYKSEMADTVDLVVVGAIYGRGKRGGKFSSLLLAAYDEETDTFKTVCKVASGFSDQELDQMQELVRKHAIPHRHPRVESSIEADVWVEPSLVMEVRGAELTLSPLHTCCLNSYREGMGISIRFPRFIRWREDKSPDDATTSKEILEMYRNRLKKVEVEGDESV